jgi:hypothetical protein
MSDNEKVEDKQLEAHKLKDAIVKLLTDNAENRYSVITPQNRKSDAEDIFQKPRVTVFYSEGSFDKRKSSVNSPYHHDCTFNIWIKVGAKVKIDLVTLQNPASTPEQYAAALANADNASLLVDEKADQLLAVLFDIIMSPAHRRLGTDYITDRWITQIKKNNPEPLGAIVTETAFLTLTAQCVEEVTGETPVEGGGGVDTIIELDEKKEQKQGVKT